MPSPLFSTMPRLVCLLIATLAPEVAAQAQEGAHEFVATYNVLHYFTGTPDDGATAETAPTRVPDGSYYGTSGRGGAFDFGSVYELAADGSQKVIYSFTGGADGGDPVGPLIRDPQGNLYGTTTYGGELNSTCVAGCGGIFKLSPDGVLTVLHALSGSQAEGAVPWNGLLRDSAGNLYGATESGGPFGAGVVFKLAPNGEYQILHSFDGLDGGAPNGSLIQDDAGNLLGTARHGGPSGGGVVFKITSGGVYTIVHAFALGTGYQPQGKLIRDQDGSIYGTTAFGGANQCGDPSGCGTIYKLAPDGTATVIYKFRGGRDGKFPNALVRSRTTGALYGITPYGGGPSPTCRNDNRSGGCGTVFVITPQGKKVILHRFDHTQGSDPVSLTKGHDGELVGTTWEGGLSEAGVIFSLKVSFEQLAH